MSFLGIRQDLEIISLAVAKIVVVWVVVLTSTAGGSTVMSGPSIVSF
jgi:hypothetical protein